MLSEMSVYVASCPEEEEEEEEEEGGGDSGN
jgi:hypothetical protein